MQKLRIVSKKLFTLRARASWTERLLLWLEIRQVDDQCSAEIAGLQPTFLWLWWRARPLTAAKSRDKKQWTLRAAILDLSRDILHLTIVGGLPSSTKENTSWRQWQGQTGSLEFPLSSFRICKKFPASSWQLLKQIWAFLATEEFVFPSLMVFRGCY